MATEQILVEYVAQVDGMKAQIKSMQVELRALQTTAVDAGKKTEESFNNAGASAESLKTQLRKLKAELAIATDPKDIERLAKAAGVVADKIGDAASAAKIFSSDSKFEQMGTALGQVGRNLLSLNFKQAADESKLLVSASKSITFKDALGGLKDVGTTLLNIGKSLLMNPLFLIGAAVTAIIANFDKLKESGGLVGDVFTGIGNIISGVIRVFTDLTDKLGLTNYEQARMALAAKNAAEEMSRAWEAYDKTEQIRLEKQTNRFNESQAQTQREIDLANAQGKNTEQLQIKKEKAAKEYYDNENKRLNSLSRAGQRRDFEIKYHETLPGKVADSQNKIDIIKEKSKIAQQKAFQKSEELITEIHLKEIANQQAASQKAIAEDIKNKEDWADAILQVDAELAEGQSKYVKEKAEKDEDERKKDLVMRQEIQAASIQLMAESANAVFDYASQKAAAMLDEDQRTADKQIEIINERIKADASYEAEGAKAILAINEGLNTKKKEFAIEQAKRDKEQAVFNILLSTSQGIVAALASLNPVLAAIIGAIGAVQLAAVIAKPIPKFAKGVIDLQGEGTGTSDSIHAKLSRGESVMTAKETTEHKELFQSIRNNNLDKFLLEKYINPRVNDVLKEGLFGSNLQQSIKLNSAFPDEHALGRVMRRNKGVDLNNADYLASRIASEIARKTNASSRTWS